MTDLITAEEAQKLLGREGDYTDQSLDCASESLARTVIALHAELAQARADTQAAVALVVERAILSVQSHYGCLMGAPPALISAIRAIADTDGTGESE